MLRPRRLFWLLFLPLAAAIGISVAAASWYAAASLQRYTIDLEAADLETEAHFARFHIGDMLLRDPAALREVCREMALGSEHRVTLVLQGGKILCDSEVSSTHLDWPEVPEEISAAFAGRIGRTTRFSRSLARSYLYVAVPLRNASRIEAVLRLGVPTSSLAERGRTIQLQMIVAAAVLILLGAAASYLLARKLAGPMEELGHAVERFAAGDFSAPIPVPRTVEIMAVGNALKTMATQIEARIQTLEEQRRLQETILAGMAEGVLAVDMAGRLLLFNQATTGMLHIATEVAAGTPLRDLPGAAPLLDFVTRAINAPTPLEEEIAAGAGGSLLLLARGTPLRDRAGERVGALVVLSDMSRVRQLEQVRWDFIANVSHELRTPLTTIAGHVELTLDNLDDPAAAKQRLGVVTGQIERLSAIIEDLLALARLESKSGVEGPAMERVSLCDILHEAIGATCRVAIHSAVRVEIDCPEGPLVRANPILLTLSVTNLLRNAISHSFSGGRVLVAGRAEGETVVIRVSDWGSGIAREHLARIFEPFYRVDSGRSRRRGGSGLGLALVRQIAIAHGGTVSVESEPGGGSVFTIRLPAAGETRALEEDGDPARGLA